MTATSSGSRRGWSSVFWAMRRDLSRLESSPGSRDGACLEFEFVYVLQRLGGVGLLERDGRGGWKAMVRGR